MKQVILTILTALGIFGAACGGFWAGQHSTPNVDTLLQRYSVGELDADFENKFTVAAFEYGCRTRREGTEVWSNLQRNRGGFFNDVLKLECVYPARPAYDTYDNPACDPRVRNTFNCAPLKIPARPRELLDTETIYISKKGSR